MAANARISAICSSAPLTSWKFAGVVLEPASAAVDRRFAAPLPQPDGTQLLDETSRRVEDEVKESAKNCDDDPVQM